jgi:hypothetical protein
MPTLARYARGTDLIGCPGQVIDVAELVNLQPRVALTTSEATKQRNNFVELVLQWTE